MSLRFLIPLLFLFTGLKAQDPLYFKVQVEGDFLDNEFYDVIQDRKGYMWFASDKGVFRYDGYSFEAFDARKGLVDNTIFSIYEDFEGKLWFLGMKGTLSYFDRDTVIAYAGNEQLRQALGLHKIAKSIYLNKNKQLLLGYLQSGIYSAGMNGGVCVAPTLYKGNEGGFRVREVDGAILPYSAETKKVTSLRDSQLVVYETANETICISLPYQKGSNNLAAIKRKNGNVCIGVKHTFIEIAPDHTFKVQQMGQELFRLYEDKDSALWISYRNSGAVRYAKNEKVAPGTGNRVLDGENITGVWQDKERAFWFTTLYSGIFYVPNMHVLQYSIVKGGKPVEATVVSRYKNGAFLVGFSNDVIAKFEGKMLDSLWALGIPPSFDRSVYDMYYHEKNDQLLIATGNSGTIPKNKQEVISVGGFSIAFVADSNAYFIGTTYGIGVLKNGKVQFENDKAKKVRIEKLLYLDDTLYASGLEGLSFMDDGLRLVKLDESVLKNIRITDMDSTADGRLLVSTKGSGLFVRNGSGKWTHFNVAAGLQNEFITGLCVDTDGLIWIAGDKGVETLDLRKAGRVTEVIDARLLLACGKINDITVINGSVLLATKKGLVHFQKQDIRPNMTPPQIYIVSMSVDEKLEDLRKTLQVNYGDNAIRIDFSGLSFLSRAKLNYKYRLLGLDDKWRSASTTFVQFISLGPGDYVFEVLAQNNDGVWSVRPAAISFSVLPPFWMTTWFELLMVILVLVLIFLIIYFWSKRFREKARIREQLITYRQQALSSQINPHFMSNLLNSIQSFIMTDNKRLASRHLSEFSGLMRMSLEHSRKEFVTLADEVKLIETYVLLESLRFNDKFEFKNKVEGINPEEILIPSMLVQTFIENAILHGTGASAGKPQISLSFVFIENILCCTVEDNGIGIHQSVKLKKSEKKKRESAGINISRERLKLCCLSMKQPFRFEMQDKKDRDPAGSGTVVIFNIPYIYNKKQDHEGHLN